MCAGYKTGFKIMGRDYTSNLREIIPCIYVSMEVNDYLTVKVSIKECLAFEKRRIEQKLWGLFKAL